MRLVNKTVSSFQRLIYYRSIGISGQMQFAATLCASAPNDSMSCRIYPRAICQAHRSDSNMGYHYFLI